MLSIKDKLRKYDFAEGDFRSLPKEIFEINPQKLSYEDRVIVEAIKFQMTVSKVNLVYQTINYNNIFKTVSAGLSFTIISFVLLSLTYYANVNFNLGLNFLTEIFA